MRVRRTVYLVVFVVASLVAAGAYWLAQPRTQVLRATVDVPVFTQLTPDMIEVVRVSPVGVPPNAARSPDAVVGMYAALPILAGQDVDSRALEAIPGSQAFGFGAPIGPGKVAFALPVTAEQAVGGALRPGALVDVIAVPARTTAAGDGAAAEPVVLGQGLVVLALRSTDGQDMATGGPNAGASTIPPKLGSVVVAIPAARLAEFASAVEAMTVFIGLVPSPTTE